MAMAMAMAMVEVLAGHEDTYKRRVLEGVRCALCESLRVPHNDPSIRLIEHQPENVIIPPQYSGRYTIVTITMFYGRSLDTKRRLYQNLLTELTRLRIPDDDVQVVVHEPAVDNWSRNGVPASDTDPGFKIDI
jgi:phenylpyruvate tautomerase PptA (4-oxalocrotonate tautomerase family)